MLQKFDAERYGHTNERPAIRPRLQAGNRSGLRGDTPSGRDAVKLPPGWVFVPLVLAVALLAMEMTDIDRTVSRWFFDAATQSFPWRYSMLLETVMHHWIKYTVILTACIAAAMLVLTWFLPELRAHRASLLFVVLAMTLAPLTVTGLKQVTDRPCPWDLAEFGGELQYFHLLETRTEAHAPGLCFPAGHASTGFALLAFHVVAVRQRRPRLARAALIAGMGAGLLLGIGRIAQGAHFLSHVLWSGLVCWLVMLALHQLLGNRMRAAEAE